VVSAGSLNHTPTFWLGPFGTLGVVQKPKTVSAGTSTITSNTAYRADESARRIQILGMIRYTLSSGGGLAMNWICDVSAA
jgi:hypothetical protein